MRTARANRLARRADRLRGDGTRGRRARRAWAALTAAAGWWDEAAVTAVRETWLNNPREVTWPDVRGWCDRADVLAAAVDPNRTAAARAALGAFCARHDLVPDNEIDRVVFFVLTGQHDRCEALDPDGTLLAGGYRGATEPTRKALRQTMLDLGAVSLVRVIADRPDRPLTVAEGDYLATQLARARDWDQLWRLVPTMPLAGAVRAARLFGDWRPPDPAGAALLTRFAATEPKAVGAVAEAAVLRIRGRYPFGFSFAPDGSELAIRDSGGTTVYDARTGRALITYPGREQFGVLALGDGTIVHKGGRYNEFSVVRCTPERRYEVLVHDRPGATVGLTPDGFVVSFQGHLRYGSATTWSRSAHVGAEQLGKGWLALGANAVDPTSGRIAMRAVKGGREPEVVLLGSGLRKLARLGGEGFYSTAFCGPNRLVRWQRGDERAIGSWRRDGRTLVRDATVALDDLFSDPVVVPARTLVALRRPGHELMWLRADTLDEVDAPPGFPATDARYLEFSRDGMLAAVARESAPGAPRRGAEVYDLGLCGLTGLLDMSLARMAPADLATVEVQARRDLPPPVAAAVALLRAGLEYRFGADIALGTGGVTAGADDIALGGDR